MPLYDCHPILGLLEVAEAEMAEAEVAEVAAMEIMVNYNHHFSEPS